MDLDDAGAVYVTSDAAPTGFATTTGALNANCTGCAAAGVVVKLSAAGAKQYATYLDGAGAGIAVDPSGSNQGRAYVVGAKGDDGYVAALAPSGASLAWDRSLAGADQDDADSAASVALDPAVGKLFVAGNTASADFLGGPEGKMENPCAGTTCQDAFVAELASGNGEPSWGRYLGGTGADEATGVAVGSNGPWVVGGTDSSDLDLVNPVQDSKPGTTSAFVAQVASDGGTLLESTYLGGTMVGTSPSATTSPATARAAAVAVHAVGQVGEVHVVGETNTVDYPVASAFQESYAGGYWDGFMTKLRPAFDLPLVTGVSPRTGLTIGGTVVTVRGTRLAGATAVDFGATRLACPSESCQEVELADGSVAIRATAPPGAPGEVLTRVTTGSGTAARTSPPTPLGRFVYTPGSWDGVADPGDAVHRLGPVAVLLGNGKVLVAGGCTVCDDSDAGLRTAELFDPLGGTWGPAPDMSFKRRPLNHLNECAEACGPSAVLLSGPRCGNDCGKVLVVGGNNPQVNGQADDSPLRLPGDPDDEEGYADTAVELYDPTAGENVAWETLSPALQKHGTAMPVVLDDGRVLFVGGPMTGSVNDPADPADRPAFCVENPDLLRCYSGPNSSYSLFHPQIYDPAGRTWHSAAPEGYSRTYGTATRLADGMVLVTGGWNRTQPSPNRLGEQCGDDGNGCQVLPQVFDPGPQPSSACGTAGHDPCGSWAPAGAVPGNRFAAATLLAGGPEVCGPNCGKILVTGGSPDALKEIVLATSELYDPGVAADQAWEATAPMVGPTRNHRSVVLPDGTVLVAGGEARHPRSDSSIFYPRGTAAHLRGRWVEAGYLVAPRSSGSFGYRPGLLGTGHAAVVLSSDPTHFEADASVCGTNCGKVLVVGDNAPAAAPPAGPTSELYTPSPSVRSVSPAGGPAAAATKVTITGTGFTHVDPGERPAVTFGGVEATDVDVLSYDTLTATVPPMADATVIDVVVTNRAGRSEAWSGGRFAYAAPGVVRNLVAVARSASEVALGFDAAGILGDTGTPASEYQVRFSRSPITDTAAFDAARELSHPPFAPTSVGQRLSLDVSGLRSGTTYYFAVRAVGPGGVVGLVSPQAFATTFGAPPLDDLGEEVAQTATGCAGVPTPGAGQVSFPGNRYSLVGGPEGTVVGAGSPLYSWFDLGARGDYAVAPGDAALQAGRGYWAWFACPKLIDLGAGQDSVAFGLGAYRASMVANPSGTSPATATGHDFAARWNPEANGGEGAYEISGYRAPQRLAVGEGAWVFSYSPTEIRIQATG